MNREKSSKRFDSRRRQPLTFVHVDFAANSCQHMRGRTKVACDCIGGELGRISQQVQRLQRKGLAKVRYGDLDLDFIF